MFFSLIFGFLGPNILDESKKKTPQACLNTIHKKIPGYLAMISWP